MKELLSDEKVKKAFFELELMPQVYDYRIKDISLYFLLRFKLEQLYRFYDNATEPSWIKKVLTTAKKQIKKTFFSTNSRKEGSDTDEQTVEYLASPFLFVSTSDWIIAEGESAEQVDLIKYYKSIGIPINFVQPGYNTKVIKKQPYHDGFYRLSLHDSWKPGKQEKKIIRDFLSFISTQWNKDLRHELDVCSWLIGVWISTAERLSTIIQKTKAKYVFARSIYTEPWIPVACQMSNTNCIEVQHGVTGPHHIYYQTALKGDSIKGKLLFPNYILTLGDEWKKIIVDQKSAFTENNTFTLGSNEFKEYQPPKKASIMNVLVCLQHGLFNVDDILISFFRKYSNWLQENKVVVIIRPHPNAYSAAAQAYDEFLGEYISMSDSRHIKFVQDLQFADVLLSPASMCLYEAIALEIPTASFARFRGVTIPNALRYINAVDDLFDFINNVKGKRYQQQGLQYLDPFNTSVLDQFVNNDSHN